MYIIFALITIVISYLWVRGITYMHENHRDYDGKDFME